MSMPRAFDVREMTHTEYRIMRVHAAIEQIYVANPRPGQKPLPADRMSCGEVVQRYEAWRLGRLP